ncbi:MAG TPA: outer membrane protein assembly factor BamD [Candidatus Binataceae bacterium]|nr:outer membrane protein assembly factor BamD [Candidatus Binataceae bacterium]
MKHAGFIAAGVIALALTGCATRKPPSGENYYVKATNEYTQHFYQPAIDDYQKLIDQYPFSPYAEEAELNIGLAYYKSHNYAESIGSLNDFVRMHPTSSHIEEASYYLAMAHYTQIGRPDQDQTHTELALEQFQTIERRFPESNFAQLAQEQVAICREMLARHEYVIGDYYFSRANYKAAESRMAELMALYPDTPVAPDALYHLGRTLEKQGKKYSAAQAFSALKQNFPNTKFAAEADKELAKLHQPLDPEEDPLKLVLAESGFSPDDLNANHIAVHESLENLASNGDAAYGPDGLPILQPKPATPAADAAAAPTKPGPATLRTIRLSSADPPMSVILDLTGPVAYDDSMDNQNGSSTLTLDLKGVTPATALGSHITFDKSIFRDCLIQSADGGTRITVNTTPVSRFAVVPLTKPDRLLVTFTPEGGAPPPDQAASSAPPAPDDN